MPDLKRSWADDASDAQQETPVRRRHGMGLKRSGEIHASDSSAVMDWLLGPAAVGKGLA